MKIPIINGIYTDQNADYGTTYPVNLIPVPKDVGINNGYLKPAEGLELLLETNGVDRGGIVWNDVHYRVIGNKLVSISKDAEITEIGELANDNKQVILKYSFDRLAIATANKLFYYNLDTLIEVTDPDLGTVLDFCWIDGYFMTTDGEFLIVTELNDPTQVNPLKYGSSEIDPDPVVALLKLRNEVYALNRNTIEVFDNVGGELFPFQRVEGAQIQKGVIGTHGCCVFADAIAFLGSGRNEAPGIYMGANATAQKLSTQEIDIVLQGYTEAQLATVKLEARNDKNHEHLYVHLPDRTLVYDAMASAAMQEQVWYTLTSAIVGFAQYRARNFVYAYDKWLVGDTQSNQIGYFVENISSHWGLMVRWEFGTLIVYNDTNGALFNRLELVALTGRVALGLNPAISTSYSLDGQTWSQDRSIRVGSLGNTLKRLVWLQQGNMRNWRIQRFKGDSQAHITMARLEAQLEPLAY